MTTSHRTEQKTRGSQLRRAVAALALGVTVVAGAAPVEAGMTTNTIAPTATLAARGHVARAHVLIACTQGQLVRFTLTLTQDGTTATGRRAGRCTGDLTAYPVVVVARGATLTPGPTTACATATNYNRGQVEDSRQWCRTGGVTLVSG